MKVKDLIEMLSKFDNEKDVVFSDYADDSSGEFNLNQPNGVEIMKTDSGVEVVCIYKSESF